MRQRRITERYTQCSNCLDMMKIKDSQNLRKAGHMMEINFENCIKYMAIVRDFNSANHREHITINYDITHASGK